jgi:hypothetical protein
MMAEIGNEVGNIVGNTVGNILYFIIGNSDIGNVIGNSIRNAIGNVPIMLSATHIEVHPKYKSSQKLQNSFIYPNIKQIHAFPDNTLEIPHTRENIKVEPQQGPIKNATVR